MRKITLCFFGVSRHKSLLDSIQRQLLGEVDANVPKKNPFVDDDDDDDDGGSDSDFIEGFWLVINLLILAPFKAFYKN